MKSVLFATAAAVAALVASPALAGDSSGYVDLSYAQTDWDWGSGSDDLANVSFGGAFVTGLSADWNVQFEGRNNSVRWNDDADDDTVGYVAAHAFKRTDRYSAGVFAGQANYYGTNGYMAGVEGQMFMDKAVLSGSLGYVGFNDWTDYSALGAQAGAKFFINDDFALNAGLGYATWDDWSDDTQTWNVSLGAEYKFSGSPASVFGEVRRDDVDYGGGSESEVDTYMVGLRWNFGSGSLKARETTGASMQGAADMGARVLAY